MKGKVSKVWSAYKLVPDNPDIIKTIVKIESQGIYYADYSINLGKFDIGDLAEEDAMWALFFDPANPDQNVTRAMWVPVEYWIARFSPEILEEAQERKEREVLVAYIASFVILVSTTIIAIVPPTEVGDFALMAGVGMVFYLTCELMIALKKFNAAIAASIVGTGYLIFGIFGLLGMLNF